MWQKALFLSAMFLSLLTIGALTWRHRSPARRWPAAGLRLDTLYWLAAPTLAAWLSRMVIGSLLLLGGLIVFRDVSHPWDGFGPVAALPLWAAVAPALVCADFASYWVHRLMHQGVLWPIHAIHHSSQELDWHSALRIHPFDRLAMQIASVAFVVALGFPLPALIAAAPIAGLIGILVHLDTSVDFGWLRYVIATPLFHRWHHADDPRAFGKNFAGIFPVWDIVFGTFHMPRNERPMRFGCSDDVPQTFWAQMAYPLKRWVSRDPE
jgi:sterol desaturase/sphingolipid hydroxylase (fatty acid hydroxylase superfamily)